MSAPAIILSAFADEAANTKTAVEQLSAMSAIGLQYYSPRFVDVSGSGKVKHVTELDSDELKSLAKLHATYGMNDVVPTADSGGFRCRHAKCR